MTVAALEAEVLSSCLAAGHDDLFARFMKGVTPIIDNAWELACGGDLPIILPADQLPRKVRMLGWYLHRLHRAANTDPVVAGAFTNVVHLNAPASSLAAPRMACRVLTARFRKGRSRRIDTTTIVPTIGSDRGASHGEVMGVRNL